MLKHSNTQGKHKNLIKKVNIVKVSKRKLKYICDNEFIIFNYPQNLWNDVFKSENEFHYTYDIAGLNEAFSELSKKEKDIILFRYKYNISLKCIGLKYAISSERIRQLIKKSFKKLRAIYRQNSFINNVDRENKKIKQKINLNELNLTIFTYNRLKSAGYTNTFDFLGKCDYELKKIRRFGEKNLEELLEVLEKCNFNLIRHNEENCSYIVIQ